MSTTTPGFDFLPNRLRDEPLKDVPREFRMVTQFGDPVKFIEHGGSVQKAIVEHPDGTREEREIGVTVGWYPAAWLDYTANDWREDFYWRSHFNSQ